MDHYCYIKLFYVIFYYFNYLIISLLKLIASIEPHLPEVNSWISG